MAVVIVLLLVSGIILLPESLTQVLHDEKAKQAVEEKRFVTAAREYAIISKSHPRTIEYRTWLFHCYVMNHDYEKAIPLISEFAGKTTEDLALLALTNTDIEMLDKLYGDTAVLSIAGNANDSTSLQQLIYYSVMHPENQMVLYLIANKLFDKNKFHETDSVCTKLREMSPDFPGLDFLEAAVQRELGEYSTAFALYDHQLELNVEDIYAITAKARLKLKMRRDVDAAEDIKTAKALEPSNILVLEAEILYDYFNGKKAEMENLLEQLKLKDAPDLTVYNRTLQVTSGEIKYR